MTKPPKLDFSLLHEKKPEIAVLMFHGMTGSPFEMKKMAKALYAAGFDVYCDCLPGHGTSEIDIKCVTWKNWYDHAIERVEELSKEYPEIYLAGLCMGAALALGVAAAKVGNVKGVISLSTTLFLDGWTIPPYRVFFPLGLHTIVRYYYTFPEREPYGLKDERIRKKIAALQKGNSVALDNYPLSCTYELLKLSKYVRKRLANVKVPVLIIHSKEDDLTSTRSAKLVYNKISSADKEYIELENSYHLIVLDNDKDLVFNKSKEFIERISGTTERELRCS